MSINFYLIYKMILSGISSLVTYIQKMLPNKAPFMNHGTIEMDNTQWIMFYLIFILLLYLTILIGTFIFNTSVTKIFPSIKKITMTDFFGLYIITHLLFC